MDIKIDFSGLVSGLLDGIKQMVTDWLSSLPDTILGWLADQVMKVWNGIWNSGINVFSPPFELTIDFPPALVLSHALGSLAYSITLLAVTLLALRTLWGNLTGRGGMLQDAVNGVLFGVFLSGSASLIVGQAFLLAAVASDAMGRLDFRPQFEPHALLSWGPDLFLGLFVLVVMIFYGWKLLVRGAYRMVLLMFLAPFAPVAGAIWGIPQIRWVSVLYWVTLGGWLAGGFLAIGAVSLAVQLAVFGNTNTLLTLVFGVALIQLAYDLMAILPKGALGGITVGSPFSAALGMAGGAAIGAIAGGAGGGAAVAGGGSGGGTVAGALPGGGESAGYGY